MKNQLEQKARQIVWLRRSFLDKVFGEADDGKKRHFFSLKHEQTNRHYYSVFELIFLLVPTSPELSKFAYEILLLKDLRFESACLDDLVAKLQKNWETLDEEKKHEFLEQHTKVYLNSH